MKSFKNKMEILFSAFNFQSLDNTHKLNTKGISKTKTLRIQSQHNKHRDVSSWTPLKYSDRGFPGFNKDLVNSDMLRLGHSIHYSISNIFWFQYLTATASIICILCLKQQHILILRGLLL